MLIIPPPKSRHRRIKTGPAPAVERPPLNVLYLQGIGLDGDTLTATAVFDTTAEQPLASVAGAAVGKWSARYGDHRYAATSLELLAFDQIRVTLVRGDAEAGTDELIYTNAPSDIRDVTGRKLAAGSWEM